MLDFSDIAWIYDEKVLDLASVYILEVCRVKLWKIP